MVTQLSILTAVLEGHADALRSTIEAIPSRDGSPFASVAGTHNGRWVVVTPRPIAPDTMLMCSATIDRPVDEWLVDFVRVLGPTADAIWSHCAGWPERGRPPDRLAFGPPRARCAVVRDLGRARRRDRRRARELVARVERLVLRAQGLDAPELLAAYREELVR